jgi:RNA polymerase sigma-70 factor (ECF subfamily)
MLLIRAGQVSAEGRDRKLQHLSRVYEANRSKGGIIGRKPSAGEIETAGSFACMKEERQCRDRLVVRECLLGSEEAWREFYARFVGLVRSIVQKEGGFSGQDADDMTQSAFVELASALETYDFNQSLPRFVSVITQRVVVDEHRRMTAAKRYSPAPPVSYDDQFGQEQANPDSQWLGQHERMERAELASQVTAALQELGPGCRQLLELRYYNDYSFSEIAGIVGDRENTLRSRTRRCLVKLRDKLRTLRPKGPRR